MQNSLMVQQKKLAHDQKSLAAKDINLIIPFESIVIKSAISFIGKSPLILTQLFVG